MATAKRKRLIISLYAIIGVIAFVTVAFFIYASIYYKASKSATEAINADSEKYVVEKDIGKVAFIPNNVNAGLVFYPGGKVEYTAYAPLMAKMAENGVLCVLVRMPFNLAVFDSNAAQDIIKEYTQTTRWYVGGHSLGGAMAAEHISKHKNKYEGLLLLGAYSTADISSYDINVISVYGSADKVLNRKKYDKCRSNLPDNFSELVIEGGCHSYFGNYGKQRGDGTPEISREEQQNLAASFFVSNL